MIGRSPEASEGIVLGSRSDLDQSGIGQPAAHPECAAAGSLYCPTPRNNDGDRHEQDAQVEPE